MFGCNFCSGEMFYLGRLGPAYWMRCRKCGLERRADEYESETIAEDIRIENELAAEIGAHEEAAQNGDV
jgi:hypothetical protein